MSARLRQCISVLVLVGSVLVLNGCFAIHSEETIVKRSHEGPDGVLIHLKSGRDDPQKVMMAFRMAEIMSAEHDVLVYCDIEAVDLLVAGAGDMHMAPFGSLHQKMAVLRDHDVRVMACPGCLEARGHSPAVLRDGVEVAQAEAFFEFTPGRIVTLDY